MMDAYQRILINSIRESSAANGELSFNDPYDVHDRKIKMIGDNLAEGKSPIETSRPDS